MKPLPYVQVAFNLPLNEAFTYEIPEPLQNHLAPGMRVVAPFGNRRLTGYVVGLTASCDPGFTLRQITDTPDAAPILSQELLGLTRWLAGYYHAGWGEAIKAALPAGLDDEIHEVFRLTPEGEAALTLNDLSPPQLKVLHILKAGKPLNRKQIQKSLKQGYRAHNLAYLKREGYIASEIQTRHSSVQYLQEKRVRTLDPADPLKLESLLKRSPRQKEIYEWLLGGDKTITDLKKTFLNYSTPLRELKRKGLAETFVQRKKRGATEETQNPQAQKEIAPEFTPDQKKVFDKISGWMSSGSFETVLLHGITGSGKTEIYMRCIQHALESGQTAIMLVPEISLTPQTVGRFRNRFGDRVAILHSGLSQTERYLEWEKIRQGRVSMAVGARSAVFAPFEKLGILIIDEEHDNSYKQDSSPRYHAREAALQRARHHNAVVILGSATPSLESRQRAESGEYRYLSLPKRIGDRLLPVVELIDMRRERDEVKNFSILSTPLRQAIRERLDRREQVFLFLNRRGTANYIVCRKCGFVFDCPHCSVSMTFHNHLNRLLCHYCNFSAGLPSACAECDGEVIRFSGFGTQKLEEETRQWFPDARITRLDRDTTHRRNAFETMFQDMHSGDIDILIGTQMITKGHDFQNVTLVGVVYADLSLHIPDFRSSERTFQLLTQVAGRAGRGKVPGLVFIQAHDPDHPVFDFVSRHDYDGFFAEEIRMRKRLHFPPFTHLVSLEVESEDEAATEQTALRMKETLAPKLAGHPGVELLGPARAALYRINKKFRWHLILRATEPDSLQKLLTECREWKDLQKTSRGKIKVTWDVDPQNML